MSVKYMNFHKSTRKVSLSISAKICVCKKKRERERNLKFLSKSIKKTCRIDDDDNNDDDDVISYTPLYIEALFVFSVLQLLSTNFVTGVGER